jgi:hypothetical protein
MLLPVLGSSLLHGRLVTRWLRLALLGVVSLGASVPARTAFAQSADDNGWFDAPAPTPAPAPAPGPTPDPYYTEPEAGQAAAPAPAAQTDVEDTDPSALTTFRPALDPYGAWVTDSSYGTVWVPNRAVVGADFAPYVSRGHWALTADDDWIWTSDYPFGWAVFHYGRWVWIAGSGWAWVPGRTYANAWVVWRTPVDGYAYVGWAPMPPTWGWRNGYAFGLWYSPPLPYVFCPSAYVFDYRVHSHIVRDRYLVHDVASHTRVYPTPYHAPAQPSARAASAPGIRSAPIGASRVPRGPHMAAAHVPPQALPPVRTAPSPNAMRLSGSAVGRSDFTRQRTTSAEPRFYSSSPRVPANSRQPFPADSVRRSAPSGSWASTPRASAPARIHVEPRSLAPARIHVAPSPSRSFTPSQSRSFGPSSHSVAPSFPHMHSGGGGSFHRR